MGSSGNAMHFLTIEIETRKKSTERTRKMSYYSSEIEETSLEIPKSKNLAEFYRLCGLFNPALRDHSGMSNSARLYIYIRAEQRNLELVVRLTRELPRFLRLYAATRGGALLEERKRSAARMCTNA